MLPCLTTALTKSMSIESTNGYGIVLASKSRVVPNPADLPISCTFSVTPNTVVDDCILLRLVRQQFHQKNIHIYKILIVSKGQKFAYFWLFYLQHHKFPL